MWKNYLLIAWRNLLRNPGYSAINILGLAVALAVCFCMLAFAWHERSYERQYSDYEQLYIIGSEVFHPTSLVPMAQNNLGMKVAQQLEGDVQVATLSQQPVFGVTHNELESKLQGTYASENFFAFFDMPFLEGDPESALTAPMSVVLPQNLATKYFGNASALGKTLLLDDKHLVTVTGVVDVPDTTHLPKIAFLSQSSHGQIDPHMAQMEQTFGLPKATYLKLAPHLSPQTVHEIATPLAYPEGITPDHPQAELFRIKVMPITDIHLSMVHGDSSDGDNHTQTLQVRNYTILNGAVLLAVVILAIACLNFINLSIASFTGRSREIAIRQTNGATQRQLFGQYMAETVSMTLLAGILATLVLPVLVTLFGNMIGRDLSAINPLHPLSLLCILGFSVLVGLVIGFYPARVLAARKPTDGFRQQAGRGRQRLQKVLIGAQFAIATTLTIVTLFAGGQLNALRNFDYGLNPENLVRLFIIGAPAQQQEAFIKEVEGHPGVLGAARPHSNFFLNMGTTGFPGYVTFKLSGQDVVLSASYEEPETYFSLTALEPRAIEIMEIPFLAGRSFIEDDLSVFTRGKKRISGGVILTASSLKKFGVSNPQTVIGQTLAMDYNPSQAAIEEWRKVGREIKASSREFEVIGVCQDFNLGSAYSPRYNDGVIYRNDGSSLLFKLSEQRFGETLAYLRQRAKEMFPDNSVTAQHITATYERQNLLLTRIVDAFISGALLAIGLAALGLYALSAIGVERRIREVGVRKVLGSSNGAVTKLLMWSLSKPVFIALLIAAPCGYLLASRLLQYFPNPIPLSPLVFVLAAVISLAVAWLTMIVRTLRAANSNPVESLRSE